MFIRDIFKDIVKRVTSSPNFIQVLIGPRQVGKTTIAKQLEQSLTLPCHYASADAAGFQESAWIQMQWDRARLLINQSPTNSALLILDEVQKLYNWSKWIKQLWDEDRFANRELKVILLGSAPWLMQKGLADSLAGRFEIIPIRHWSFSEMQQAFDLSLDQYIYFGGYPGAAQLIDDELRWKRYITDSLIETTLSRDILSFAQINKPALLRQLFQLSCDYSGQILSYQKMLGQLDDAGNTTTLAHYLQLLDAVGLVTGLNKYAPQKIRQRNSSPKLMVLDSALMSNQLSGNFAQVRQKPEIWGRLVESTVGAYLYNQTIGTNIEVYYWREGHKEVDFVLYCQERLVAIEVKSGANKKTLAGLEAFVNHYHPDRIIQVGQYGISIDQFLRTPIQDFCSP